MENNLSPKKPKLVFVSHSGEDTWVARQIAKEISLKGAKTFLDEADVDVSAKFEDDIRNAIDFADEFLVLLTPWALKSFYVSLEIGAAWQRRIPIVVVLHGLTETDMSKRKLPVMLKERSTIKLNDIDKYLNQLGSRVASEEN